MKSVATLFLAATAPLLAGCIIIDGDDDTPTLGSSYAASQGGLGSVFGAQVTPETVSFVVTSNGCTDESYFDVDVEPRSNRAYRVSIDRIRADTCEAIVPDGVEVRYDLAALGIPDDASVTVSNPIRRTGR